MSLSLFKEHPQLSPHLQLAGKHLPYFFNLLLNTAPEQGEFSLFKGQIRGREMPIPQAILLCEGWRMQSEANWRDKRMILNSSLAGVTYLSIYHFKLCL